MPGPEFDDDEGADVLELGGSRARWFGWLWTPRRLSPGVQALGWTIAVGVGLLIGLHSATSTDRAAQRPVTVPHEVARISLATVRELAGRQVLTDYVRQTSAAGSCALVPVGHAPQRIIAAAMHAALPGYTVRGVARTLDQFTGLCSIEVRATHRSDVLFVTVTSPPAHPSRAQYTRVETGVETDAGITTKYALALNPAGWTVLVGATGDGASLPGAQDLVRLSQEPSLIW